MEDWGYFIVIVIGIVCNGCCAGAQASLFLLKRITLGWRLGLAMFLFSLEIFVSLASSSQFTLGPGPLVIIHRWDRGLISVRSL